MARRWRYDARPQLVYWELTRACQLACRHCRAVAVPWRHPAELSTSEGIALLDALRGFGEPLPHLVLTGGDPLARPDLFTLIHAARERGFTVSITPSGTYALTEDVLAALAEAGIATLALSLDGATADRHDALRGVPGSFDWTIAAARRARALGIPLQVNTLVCAETRDDLPAMLVLVSELGVARWSLFFLVPVGRGRILPMLSPDEAEAVLEWLAAVAARVPFAIKTTEAPFYRRVVLQRQGLAGSETASTRRSGFGVRDGNGIVFVSHTGDIYPAGFLPLAAGNVRSANIVDVYRNHPLFLALRDPDRFHGKCGQCEFRFVCGGSRSRAYAVTGDPLESDPLCPYQPGQTRARPSMALLAP